MAYTRNYNAADPANADPFANGAQEIRELEDDIWERLDSVVVDGGAITPPTAADITAANVDRGHETNLDPMWLRGDRIIPAGMTWRRQANATVVTYNIPDNTVYATIPGVTVTITPVSAASILLLYAEAHYNVVTTAAAAKPIKFRIQNTTAAATVGTEQISGGHAAIAEYVGTISLNREVTGLTGANTFELQCAMFAAAGTSGRNILGSFATILRVVEMV